MTTSIESIDLLFVRSLVHDESGIVFEEDKDYLVKNRLQRIAVKYNFDSISSLIREIRQNRSSELIQDLIDVLTTNETSFFRDPRVFDYLGERIIPDLFTKLGSQRKLRIWCCATSTGQEPYSIIMTIHKSCPAVLNWDFSLFATDISNNALNYASKGFYRDHEVNRGLPTACREQYFTEINREWAVKSILKKYIVFKNQNLMKPFSNRGPFDIIFIRNILIYFSNSTKVELLERISRVLTPGGYLFLGTSEVLSPEIKNFKLIDHSRLGCYQYCP